MKEIAPRRKHTSVTVALIAVVTSLSLVVAGCSDDESLRSIGDSPDIERNEGSSTPGQGGGEAGGEAGGEGEEQGGGTGGESPTGSGDPTTTNTLPDRPNANITKPEGVPTEMWWLRSEIMDWFFNQKPGEIPNYSEDLLGEWTLHKNSDIESPEDYAQLVEQGKQQALRWLTATGNEERFVLPPAEGVTIQAASAAKSAQVGPGGEQLYRVAVLWGARKDRYGNSVANQMVEMFFTGSSGNWRYVTCVDVGPDACVPLFQTIL